MFGFHKKSSEEKLLDNLAGREAEAIRRESFEKERFKLASQRGKIDAKRKYGNFGGGGGIRGIDFQGVGKKINKMSKDLEKF